LCRQRRFFLTGGQIPLGAVTLTTQHPFSDSPMDGYRKMANALHFNTIRSTFQDELCNGFTFHAGNQKNERDVLLHLAQEV
jgi:hypothetical protein